MMIFPTSTTKNIIQFSLILLILNRHIIKYFLSNEIVHVYILLSHITCVIHKDTLHFVLYVFHHHEISSFFFCLVHCLDVSLASDVVWARTSKKANGVFTNALRVSLFILHSAKEHTLLCWREGKKEITKAEITASANA